MLYDISELLRNIIDLFSYQEGWKQLTNQFYSFDWLLTNIRWVEQRLFFKQDMYIYQFKSDKRFSISGEKIIDVNRNDERW
jgi:hypothetical protein